MDPAATLGDRIAFCCPKVARLLAGAGRAPIAQMGAVRQLGGRPGFWVSHSGGP